MLPGASIASDGLASIEDGELKEGRSSRGDDCSLVDAGLTYGSFTASSLLSGLSLISSSIASRMISLSSSLSKSSVSLSFSQIGVSLR